MTIERLIYIISKKNGAVYTAPFVYYCSIAASTGQTFAHAPQELHFSGSMIYLSAPSEMHDAGHSDSHAPQEMHSSLMTYAIDIASLILCRITPETGETHYILYVFINQARIWNTCSEGNMLCLLFGYTKNKSIAI